jgi:hypothetical protein
MERYTLQIRIVLLALDTSGRVLTVLSRNVPRCAGNVGFLLFCALQNYLNSITFLSHGYMLFLNGSAKIGNENGMRNGLFSVAVSFLW